MRKCLLSLRHACFSILYRCSISDIRIVHLSFSSFWIVHGHMRSLHRHNHRLLLLHLHKLHVLLLSYSHRLLHHHLRLHLHRSTCHLHVLLLHWVHLNSILLEASSLLIIGSQLFLVNQLCLVHFRYFISFVGSTRNGYH